jgi:hypothetical protein
MGFGGKSTPETENTRKAAAAMNPKNTAAAFYLP